VSAGNAGQSCAWAGRAVGAPVTVIMPKGAVLAAAMAALLAGKVRLRDRDRVAVVLSGGNVEVGRLGELIDAAGSLPGATAASQPVVTATIAPDTTASVPSATT
jgi:threonine dehydratase